MKQGKIGTIAAAGVALAGLALIPPSDASAAVAAGTDIKDKTVYVQPGAWLRYNDSLVSRIYTTTKFTLEVKGRGVCTSRLCPVTHNGVEVWAMRNRLDLDKPGGDVPVMTERTLRSGDDGEDVKVLQQALVKAGQKIEVDGKFGSSTEEAVRAVQKKAGLTVDGEVGKETRAKLGL